MASGEKVITLSHNQLQDLAHKHGNMDPLTDKNNVPKGQQKGQRKSNKKPDVEIYRPGMVRRGKRSDTESSSHSSVMSPENAENVSHQLADLDLTQPQKEDSNGYAVDREQRSSGSVQSDHRSPGSVQTDHRSSGSVQTDHRMQETSPTEGHRTERGHHHDQRMKEKSPTAEEREKRRRKRPDMQRYVPRPRQPRPDGQQDPTIMNTESSDRRTQGGGAREARGGARAERGGARTVNQGEGGHHDIAVTVSNEAGSSQRHVSGKRRQQQPQNWEEGGGGRSGHRQRSTDSIGSVEFLDDGLEWDYQVDINVEPKGEEDDDLEPDLEFEEDIGVGLLGDLEEYEGLPVRPPMQGLLGIDTFDTLRELDISLSGEEAFDEVLQERRRKSRPGSARVKNSPQWREKLKLQRNFPQDGDSPRSTGSQPGFYGSDKEDSPHPDQFTLTTKVPPVSTGRQQEQVETSPNRNTSKDRVEDDRKVIDQTQDSRIVVENNSKKGRGHSYRDQRPAGSPKEQRKDRQKDGRDRQRSGRNKGREESGQGKLGHNEREAQKKDNSKDHLDNRNKEAQRGKSKEKTGNDRKSVEKDATGGKSNTYSDIKNKKKGSHNNNNSSSSNNKTSKKEEPKHPTLGWGDRMELGDEEIDFEHEVVDFGSETSSQSSVRVRGNTPEETDKPAAGRNKYEEGKPGRRQEDGSTYQQQSPSKGRGRGRGRGVRNHVDDERPSSKDIRNTQENQNTQNSSESQTRRKSVEPRRESPQSRKKHKSPESRNSRSSPEKSRGTDIVVKVTQNNRGSPNRSVVTMNMRQEENPQKQPPKVTEYDMEGDSFSGLVITNSNLNSRQGNSKESPRRRHASGDTAYGGDSNRRRGDNEDRNKTRNQQRRASHDQGTQERHNRHSYSEESGEGDRWNVSYGSNKTVLMGKSDRRLAHDQRSQRSQRSPEGEGQRYRDQRGFYKQDRRHHSSERRRTVSHSSTDSGPPTSAKGGGILHLPPPSTESEMSGNTRDSNASPHHYGQGQFDPQHQQGSPRQMQQQPHPHHHGNRMMMSDRGRGRGRGRGGTHRTLYDPNNPQPKVNPASSSSSGNPQITNNNNEYRNPPGDPNTAKPLHFHDSGEETPSPSAAPGGNSPSFPPFPGGSPMFRPPPPGVGGYMRGPRPGMGVGGFMPPPPPNMPHMMMGRPPIPGYGPGYFPPHDYAIPLDMNFGQPMLGEDDGLQLYNYEAQESGGRSKSRSQNRDKAEALLRVVVTMETQLNGLLAKRIRGMEDFTRIMGLKKEFQLKCVEVLILDPETCNLHSVEQLMWKTAFYQLIEVIRKEMASGESWEPYMLRQSLMGVLDEGDAFYEKLLQDLQSHFGFSLSQFYDPVKPYPSHLGRSAKLALYSAHICLLCLGDLARYREQINQTANYGKARSWYMKAQQVMPKNGRPYNQLAILAMYTKRKLEAVYYFMRSLAASNPFLNGREILMSIFDDIRKKAEVVEQKRLSEKSKHQQRKPRQKNHGHRLEIWFHPDGSSSEDRIEEEIDENDELASLSANELNKRFTLSFLNVHGKLFTKIGMESFPEASSLLLHELRTLLTHSPSPVSVTRLQQLVTVNMFAIHNVLPKDQSQLDENCRPLLQEYAVQLGLDMFAVIADHCLHLLREHVNSGDPQLFSREVEELVPSLILWGNWMTVHVNLWNPPPLPRDPQLGPVVDVWQITAELNNLLNSMSISHIKLYRKPVDGCEMLILPEAAQMAGFVPLNLCSEEDRYVHASVDKVSARNFLRVEKLKTLAEVLAGIDEPLLRWSGEKHRYEAVMRESKQEEEGRTHRKESESDDVIVESESEEEMNVSGETDEIRELKAKREELQRQVAHKERQEQTKRQMFEESQNTRVELEVHPTFLVPDTNCFIDHLPAIERLTQTRRYTLIVPLIVITELDGLSKGSKEGHYDSFEHAEKVKKGAQSTVEFLEREFEARNRHLRAITSKGNVMETISFRSEEVGPGGNNDDLILSCCLHYCQDKARDFMPKDRDEPIRLYREVILLTDDRNLRLKAHTRNVPAKEVLKFFRWAKIG